MVYQVKRGDLKGKYDWVSQEVANSPNELDKCSGPDVLAFIQAFYDERDWQTDSNVHAVEDYLQLSFLSSVRSKAKLFSYLRTEFV